MEPSFVHDPKRDAWAIIRGFYYQMQITILRWLDLDEATTLVCECGEDIDHVTQAIGAEGFSQERLLEQVKLRSQPVSLANSHVNKALDDFLVHCERNLETELRFRFTSNATPTKERAVDFPRGLAGILAWQAVAANVYEPDESAQAIESIRKVLSSRTKADEHDRITKSALVRLVSEASNDELFQKLISRVEWSVGSTSVEECENQIIARLIEDGYARDEIEAGNLAYRLIAYAIRKLSRPSIKTLTKSDLNDLLAQPLVSSGDARLIENLRQLHGKIDQMSAQLARIEQQTSAAGPKIDSLHADFSEYASRQSEAENRRDELEVEKLLSAIRQGLDVYEFQAAFDAAQQLREWMSKRTHELPDYIAIEVFEALANVEVIRTKETTKQGMPVELSSARALLEGAKSANRLGTCEVAERLASLEANIVAIEEGPDVGLAQLEGKNDPHSLRRKLIILRNAERTAEATALIRGKQPHELWCEQAAFVLALEDGGRAAERLLNWCKSLHNDVTRDRCLLGYAHGLYERLVREHSLAEAPLPGDLTAPMKETLEKVRDVLQPITLTISGRGRVDRQLDAWVLEIALRVQCLLNNRRDCDELADLLSTYKPIPLSLAKLAINQQIDMPNSLPERLRTEHPDSFEAKLMASVIERDLLHQPEVAFDSAMELVDEAVSPEQRRELCTLLAEISQDLGPEAREEVNRTAPSLLTKDDRFLEILQIDSLLRNGQAEEAGALLEEIQDEEDPLWLQMLANYLIQKGEMNQAVEYLLKVGKIMPHPEVLWRTAALAHHLDRLNDAAETLRMYVLLRPRDVRARSNLAMIYIDLGQYDLAAREFAELQILEPDDPSHAFNHMVSLAISGDTNGAAAVFESALRGKDVPLQFLLQRAELAKALGKPQEALALLREYEDQYWNEPGYLVAFVSTAFAAGDESAANEAFVKLQQLQTDGKVTQDTLQAMSLDELVENVRKHRERSLEIHQNMLKAHASWLMAEDFLGRVPYLGWWIRTLPLDWLGDDSLYRTERTIYSTNAFAVLPDEQGRQSLELIECPSTGTPIVADLSALITLHRLGILKTAADYFSKILIPAIYQSSILHDSSQLVFHQLSQKTALEEIRTLVEIKRRIRVDSNPPVVEQVSILLVDEYVPEQKGHHCYHLRDVLDALRTASPSLITEARYNELLRIAQKPAAADHDHGPISAGQQILVGLSTLRTLCQAGALDTVTKEFSVYITPQDWDEVVGSLDAMDKQQEVREWHMDLWNTIRNDSRFIWMAHFTPPELKRDKDEPKADVFIAAFLLARQMQIPLLVDDRMFQAVALNENRGNRHAAFGTDHLLVALLRSEQLDVEIVADHLLKMMKWRYKFIIPPVEVLKNLAGQFANPPGKSLQEMALHVHDCMRDPGLLIQFVPTHPPQAMAIRLFDAWISNITDFVMDVWADSAFDSGRAEGITAWAMSEFLPSLPQVLAPWHRAQVSLFVNHMVMTRAVLRSVTIADAARANRAIQTIARGLNIDPDDDEYLQLVTGVINET